MLQKVEAHSLSPKGYKMYFLLWELMKHIYYLRLKIEQEGFPGQLQLLLRKNHPVESLHHQLMLEQ